MATIPRRVAILGGARIPFARANTAYVDQGACGTSLTAVATLANRIALGEIDSAIAGGSDSASDIPISYGRNLQRIVLASARGKSFLEKTRPWLQLRPKDFKPS